MIDELKKRALHRTRILEGQLRGLEKMIADEEYCVDIVTQSLAIQKSLKSLNKLVVENHLRTHVAEMFAAGGDDAQRAVDELLKVYELENNRSH
ncbi:MAG TPA: metal-sensitive transcriptional regulator [Rhodoglobus sp.]|nr:metal-sensitive transcriptional regulator [Rhodoglobus sp.]